MKRSMGKVIVSAALAAVMTAGCAGGAGNPGAGTTGSNQSAGADASVAATDASGAAESGVPGASEGSEASKTESLSLKIGDTAPRMAATLDDNDPAKNPAPDYSLKAGEELLNIKFDNDTDGFVVYTNSGKMTLGNKDGMLDCHITDCGSLDYANQAYWDGFELSEGCEYTYSFDISSTIERKVEYRLQLNGGDYRAYQGEKIKVGPEVTNFSVDFTMKDKSDPAPRVVFNMGKMDDMSSDPGDHHVYIDNIVLTVKNADNAKAITGVLPAYLKVNINQAGYTPDDSKTVFVKTENSGEDFYICNSEDGKVVWQGKLSDAAEDPASRAKTARGDFSEFKEAGNYFIITAEGASYPFKIGEDVYKDIYKDVVLLLYRQRCGVATDKEIAGDFAHDKCHDKKAVILGTDTKIDVSGGWHDAGDYGRYVVSGAKTVSDLLEAYEDFHVESDDLGIPESGNKIPDLLDEARFELDWMLKMQDPKTGGVYHKVTGMVFPGMVAPEKETEQMVVTKISTAATGDFAAVMAKASVVYKDIDPDFSAKAYKAAVKAWGYAGNKIDYFGFTNPGGMETGEYPDTNTFDERYWAAAELYLATMAGVKGSKESDAAEYSEFVTKYIDDRELKDGLGWADVGFYPVYDLAKSGTPIADSFKSKLIAAADKLIADSASDMYYQSLGTNYPWGSNMTVASNGEILYMTSLIAGEDKAAAYKAAASRQLDYLLGANPMGICYVTGYGTFSPSHVHHRPSVAAGKTVPGMLVGGPCSTLSDPYAEQVLRKAPPSMCYVDNDQSYSTNEITVYWNSPLIYILAAE